MNEVEKVRWLAEKVMGWIYYPAKGAYQEYWGDEAGKIIRFCANWKPCQRIQDSLELARKLFNAMETTHQKRKLLENIIVVALFGNGYMRSLPEAAELIMDAVFEMAGGNK